MERGDVGDVPDAVWHLMVGFGWREGFGWSAGADGGFVDVGWLVVGISAEW